MVDRTGTRSRRAFCKLAGGAFAGAWVSSRAVGEARSKSSGFSPAGLARVGRNHPFSSRAAAGWSRGMRGKKRILARRSVDAMITDQITPAQKKASPFYPGFWDTHGWGFGLSMTTAPDDISKVPGRYGWDGGYGTTYIADPHEDLVVIPLTQRVVQGPDDFAINQETVKLAYQAIG
jgi:CubicO group peptidase (beta-lactamase class C family)